MSNSVVLGSQVEREEKKDIWFLLQHDNDKMSIINKQQLEKYFRPTLTFGVIAPYMDLVKEAKSISPILSTGNGMLFPGKIDGIKLYKVRWDIEVGDRYILQII